MSDGSKMNLDKYVQEKLESLEKSDRDFRSIFLLMTRDRDFIFAEKNDGYAITKTTYGQFRDRSEQMAGSLKVALGDLKKGSFVGLYMNNCEEWLEIFWGILINGWKPVLMNTRMSDVLLEDILAQYDVKVVVTDGKTFSSNTVLLSEIKKQQKESPVDSISAESNDWANEIALMSSGTTANVKLCIYNGETVFYQISDSAKIIKENKLMKAHFEGSLKQLTFLPFYHVFGLMAVFMWFGYFGRTFVFLNDFSSQTLLNTVRRHKVTHIFSIPLLWNTVYETVVRTAKESGQYEKLQKAIGISKKLSKCRPIGNLFNKLAFKSVREQIFGESIRFLISGGSNISEEVLEFFNAIGYHICDGYGMTEVGITSVELSYNPLVRNSRSIGKPFSSVSYKISDEGELLVKGDTMADIVMEGGKVVDRTENGWFHTNDLASFEDGKYYILGRKDDVIISPSGENLNPDVLEDKINIEGAEQIVIVSQKKGENKYPTLVVKIPFYATAKVMKDVQVRSEEVIKEMDLDGTISKVLITRDALMTDNDFKLNRRAIALRIENGEIKPVNPDTDEIKASDLEKKVVDIIGKVLGIEASKISPQSNMFYDLGGTSLDYFTIAMEIQNEFSVSLPSDGEKNFSTAREFAEFIEKSREKM